MTGGEIGLSMTCVFICIPASGKHLHMGSSDSVPSGRREDREPRSRWRPDERVWEGEVRGTWNLRNPPRVLIRPPRLPLGGAESRPRHPWFGSPGLSSRGRTHPASYGGTLPAPWVRVNRISPQCSTGVEKLTQYLRNSRPVMVI